MFDSDLFLPTRNCLRLTERITQSRPNARGIDHTRSVIIMSVISMIFLYCRTRSSGPVSTLLSQVTSPRTAVFQKGLSAVVDEQYVSTSENMYTTSILYITWKHNELSSPYKLVLLDNLIACTLKSSPMLRVCKDVRE